MCRPKAEAPCGLACVFGYPRQAHGGRAEAEFHWPTPRQPPTHRTWIEKDTRHHEIAIDGQPATYQPGDALGIHPRNNPALVDRVLAAVGARGDEPVTAADGTSVPLGQALIETYNLSTPGRKLFENLIAKGAADLAPLLDKANAEQFKHFVNGWNEAHDVLDLLDAYPACRLTPVELVESLRKGIPRLSPSRRA